MTERGIQVVPEDNRLTERARDYLAAGPATAAELVARVCQIPAPPPAVAEGLAAALLADRPDFVRGADGRWRLASDSSSAAAAERQVAVPLSFDQWRARRESGELIVPASLPTPADLCAPEHVTRSTPGASDRLDSIGYVVVDVETTGGAPASGHRITEIAAVVVRGGVVVDQFQSLVNPRRLIPSYITRLTNITNAMVADAPPFEAICEPLLRVLKGNVFVAHNVSFDWKFVSTELSRASGQQLLGRRLCTVRLARKLLPQLRSRSLHWVAQHYGVDNFAPNGGTDPMARHRALGDALATAHCLRGLLRDAADRGVETWESLQGLLSTPSGRKSSSRRRRSGAPRPVDKDTTA